uniref:DYW domain-containing protein n=1 Tax=Fagus sylvatica TaxID=28930 RepID=A0A2N9FRT6_FAGSY
MVTLSRKFSTTAVPNPKLSQPQPQNTTTTQFFIPFSQLQQRKPLESRLVSILDGCTHLTQIKQVHAHILRKGLDQCCYCLTKLIRMLTKLDVPVHSYPRIVFHQVKYPNPFLWTALIRGYAVQGPFLESVVLYNRMRSEGTGPIHAQTILIGGFASDLFVGNTMIDMYVKCGFLECARKVFDEMPMRNVVSWTELIVAYAKSGDMGSAWELFRGLPVKDMVAWTAMVTGYAQNGKPREALECFERMQDAGVKTDEVTLVGVISACALLGATKYGNWVRGVAESYGFGPTENVVVGSALIDMYSKCGIVEDAYNIFEGMKERNVYSYSSMIVGFAMHGRAHAAMQLFHEMLKTEIRPNKRNHYACMVDLLGRAGRLEEALELIETMPIEPHGRWDDVSRLRKLVREKGLKKNPGCSWVESKEGVIHEFYAGDMTHPQYAEIKRALADLLDRLKAKGYQPNLGSVTYDISDDEKKLILMNHSEKLALAYGLLNTESTDAGCTIQIMKNLRICEDCHAFMCSASQVTGREIVVRDNMRFHHFRDGACSCDNFW